MCAGGKHYLPQAIVLLRVLRFELLSTIPVEIFYHGEEEIDGRSLEVCIWRGGEGGGR
jgi:hypothetical protein